MNKPGRLIVIPTSGLANRLRVFATAMKLARETNKKLLIYWQANKYLNAEFEQLFEFPGNVKISTPPLRYLVWLRLNSIAGIKKAVSQNLLKLFRFDFIFLDNMAELVWHNKLNIKKEVAQGKNVFMCTCQELNYFDLEDYKVFIPKKELLGEIEKISNRFSTHTIGIHIRATDNAQAKENSPFSVFLKRIEDEILTDPDVTFFLSTDDEEYEKELIGKFGSEKIMVHKKVFGRDSAQGIKDAVIDLFCLSKTSKIYGSYFSSFSYVAGRIGNIDVEVLKR